MPFQKGNKYGKGRPPKSENKLSQENKKFLNDLLFNPKQLREDFNNLDINGRMEFRCRMAKYIMPEQKQLEVNETKSASIDFKRLISNIKAID
ncbi:MAG: hypothetical protein CL853_03955 [Crocinitomicaceae bacterium]|nr:hypothetical protein [Crocinitomicaceae bacterium]|tara:strand:+ start:601 stop:879 length:279 start_codon:yes stop_codon:yes gene_type:complete